MEHRVRGESKAHIDFSTSPSDQVGVLETGQRSAQEMLSHMTWDGLRPTCEPKSRMRMVS